MKKELKYNTVINHDDFFPQVTSISSLASKRRRKRAVNLFALLLRLSRLKSKGRKKIDTRLCNLITFFAE